MNYMDHIYRELEKTTQTGKVHKFTVLVTGDVKEIYENEYLIAKVNTNKKSFYTEYKLMGDVIFFSRYLKGLGYTCVKLVDELDVIKLDSNKRKSLAQNIHPI